MSVLTCQCGKVLSEANPCPIPRGKVCLDLNTPGKKEGIPDFLRTENRPERKTGHGHAQQNNAGKGIRTSGDASRGKSDSRNVAGYDYDFG